MKQVKFKETNFLSLLLSHPIISCPLQCTLKCFMVYPFLKKAKDIFFIFFLFHPVCDGEVGVLGGYSVLCSLRPQKTHQGCEHPLLCKLPSCFHGQSPCSSGGCVVQRQQSGRVCVTARDAPTPRVSSYTLSQSQPDSSPGHWNFGSRIGLQVLAVRWLLSFLWEQVTETIV